MNVAVIARTMLPRDAVSNDAVVMFQYLTAWRHNARLYCEYAHPELEASTWPIDALVDWKPDVVIYHHSNGWSKGLRLISSLPGQVIIRYHNVTPPEYFVGSRDLRSLALTFQGRIETALFPRLLEEASYWAASYFNARELVALGAEPDRVHVLAPLEAPDNHADFVLDVEKRCGALFVGRFAFNKGQHNLIRLWRAMAEISPDFVARFPLHLVGKLDPSGHYEATVLNAIRTAGLTEVVVLHDNASESELRHLYQTTAVYISLSMHEGFGVPVLEAMRSGLPVVALAAGGVPEVLEDTGVTFTHLNFRDLGRTIMDLINDPPRRAHLAELQAIRAETVFNHRVAAEKLRVAFETCVARDEAN